jgi:hypothetical protein
MNDRPRGGSSFAAEGGRKSYLQSRNRPTTAKVERADHVKDSLMKFLDDAQDEDLIFTACSPVKGSRKKKTTLSSASAHGGVHVGGSFSGDNNDFPSFSSPRHAHGRPDLGTRSDHISKSIESPMMSPLGTEGADEEQNHNERQLPFDRKTSVIRKNSRSKSHGKSKLRRSGSKRAGSGRSTTGNNNHNREEQDDSSFGNFNDDGGVDGDNNDDNNSFEDDLQSFALEGEEKDFEDDVTLSSNEDIPKRRIVRNNSSSSMGQIRTPRRVQSLNDPSTRRRTRSSSRGRLANNSSSSPHQRRGLNRTMSLNTKLGNMERQARRDRMKSRYRTPSRDARSVGKNCNDDDCDDDGNESVASGTSQFSTRSSMTTRKSGLEGGALNAFLVDADTVRNARKGRAGQAPSMMMNSGESVMSCPADEKFIEQRKARQDLIMDVALKEKYANEARSREEELAQEGQHFEQSNGDDESDSDESLNFGKKKKKGFIGRMQRAAKKTAKVSKSGAKGTVNVVKDPKRAAKKVGGFAKSVGKETGKMVLDPTLAGKRGVQGIKGTMKLTTKVTKKVGKGSLGMTTSLAKTGLDVTSLVVGSTIDGTAHLVNGATGLIIKKKGDDDGIEYDEYDPRLIQGRQKDNSLVSRFANADMNDGETAVDDSDIFRRSLQRHSSGYNNKINTPTVLAPSIQARSSSGSWDV